MVRIVFFALLLLIGCRRSEEPSPEFIAARAALDETMSRTLDSSFGDPAYDEVARLFRSVPSDASDYGKAQAFLSAILKARAEAEDTAAEIARKAPLDSAGGAKGLPAAEAWPEPAVEEEDPPEPGAADLEPEPSAAVVAPVAAAEPVRRSPRNTVPVIVYSTSWCRYCKSAIAYLNRAQVPYVEKDIEADASFRAEMVSKVGRGGGVPVVDVGGMLLRGFNEPAMRRALEQRGYL